MEETNSVNGKVDENIEQRHSETPLTVLSQTPGTETNENETLLGQESEDSHDLFEGISINEADPQPKEEENNAVAEVAEERSVSRHPMTTRSKSGVLCKGTASKSHKTIGKKNSLRSFRSPSTTLSLRSAFSDTQLTGLHNTMKTNQDRRIEKNKLESRFLQEEALLHESWEQEYAELEGEWWKRGKMEREYYGKRFLEKEKRLREEEKQLQEEERIREEKEHSRQHQAEIRAFQQKCEGIHHKRKQEMERLHRRRQRDLQELGNRSQREQLELDVERSETLPENRLANTSSIKNIDRPLNKLAQAAITPSANSNAVPAISTPNITTVPASTSVQFPISLQPMTCTAANQQNRIMTPSNAAVPNSGAKVNVANSYPSSKIGIDAERRNSVRSETLRKMKNLGMDVDKINIWRVIVNPDGVSTTSVIRNMDRGCLISSSRRFTESISRSKKFKINGEERFVSELDIIELPNTLYDLVAMVVWFDLETLQLFAHNLANRLAYYRITYNLDSQSSCSIQPRLTSVPIFPIKKFVDLIEGKKHEGGEVTGEEGIEIHLNVSASPVDCWLHGYIPSLAIRIIPEGILH